MRTFPSSMSLRERCLAYLTKHPIWIASGDFQRMVAAKTTYTPSYVARELRKLCEDGMIEVSYRKNHAFYKVKTTQAIDNTKQVRQSPDPVSEEDAPSMRSLWS